MLREIPEILDGLKENRLGRHHSVGQTAKVLFML